MIKLVRIDDRLVHGQVAFTWVPSLEIDCLLVANDKVAKDDFQKMTLGLAKPAGAKLLIKSIDEAAAYLNDDKNKSQNILVLTNAVADAAALTEATPTIKSINLGGLRSREGTKPVSRAVALNADELETLRQLVRRGIEVEIRQVPSDTRQTIESLQ